MNPSASRFLRVAGLSTALVLLGASIAPAEPFVPKDDREVLERLRPVAFDPAAREMRALRSQLSAKPQNVELALAFARRCLERHRAEADPRYLGHAQSALSPWWTEPQPPVEVLVLRATIKQSEHDFTNGLTDLNLALQIAPANAQAWLTRATILTVLGRYEEARRACIPLARLAPGLIAVTAAATVSTLTGSAERSCELLRSTLEGSASAGISEKLWALTILAETSARLGRTPEAEEYFQRALRLGQRDVYLLGAFADFLLDQGRVREVAALLKDETRADGLLLRLCLAESAVGPVPNNFVAQLSALRARFEANRLRGDHVHQREESRFTLKLLRQPREALRLAHANWQVQREPADARILLESALAVDDRAAAAPVLDFIQKNQIQDVQLAKLMAQWNTLAAQ